MSTDVTIDFIRLFFAVAAAAAAAVASEAVDESVHRDQMSASYCCDI